MSSIIIYEKCVCMCVGTMSEDSLLQLVLFFYHVGSWRPNLVTKPLFYPLYISPALVGLDFLKPQLAKNKQTTTSS